jgi:protein-disulfide isomerase
MSDQDTSPSAMRPIAVLEPGTLAQTPLTEMHPHAEHAAGAAEAAGAEGEFWEMHDTLYTHQAALDDRHLVQYATSLGIPAPVFQEAIQAHTYMDRIRQDFLSGVRSV